MSSGFVEAAVSTNPFFVSRLPVARIKLSFNFYLPSATLRQKALQYVDIQRVVWLQIGLQINRHLPPFLEDILYVERHIGRRYGLRTVPRK